MCKICIQKTQVTEKKATKRAVSSKSLLWEPNTQITFRFLSGNDYQKNRIRTAIETWMRVGVALQIREVREDEYSDCRIDFLEGAGSWSYVGNYNRTLSKTKPNMPTMNIGWDDGPGSLATELHELGHLWGLQHEHQSPFNNPLEWIPETIYKDMEQFGWSRAEVNRNIIQRHSPKKVKGTSFDPDSIMLYWFPGTWVRSGMGTNQNQVLSEMDKIHFSQLYRKTKNEEPMLISRIYAEIFPQMKDLFRLREENIIRMANQLGIHAELSHRKKVTINKIWKILQDGQ